MECPNCQGAGKSYKSECNDCKGHGVFDKDETVEVKIPAGIKDGDGIQIDGKGHAIKGGTDGAMIIIITEKPHDVYARVGNDLRMRLPLDYSDLVLGTQVEVPIIEGKKIRVTIPEYSDVGDNLRIRSKGMKYPNSNTRGDMIIELDVEMPKETTDEEKELLKKLKNIKK
jgi:molecular chaperone DnaJ